MGNEPANKITCAKAEKRWGESLKNFKVMNWSKNNCLPPRVCRMSNVETIAITGCFPDELTYASFFRGGFSHDTPHTCVKTQHNVMNETSIDNWEEVINCVAWQHLIEFQTANTSEDGRPPWSRSRDLRQVKKDRDLVDFVDLIDLESGSEIKQITFYIWLTTIKSPAVELMQRTSHTVFFLICSNFWLKWQPVWTKSFWALDGRIYSGAKSTSSLCARHTRAHHKFLPHDRRTQRAKGWHENHMRDVNQKAGRFSWTPCAMKDSRFCCIHSSDFPEELVESCKPFAVTSSLTPVNYSGTMGLPWKNDPT